MGENIHFVSKKLVREKFKVTSDKQRSFALHKPWCLLPLWNHVSKEPEPNQVLHSYESGEQPSASVLGGAIESETENICQSLP